MVTITLISNDVTIAICVRLSTLESITGNVDMRKWSYSNSRPTRREILSLRCQVSRFLFNLEPTSVPEQWRRWSRKRTIDCDAPLSYQDTIINTYLHLLFVVRRAL